VCVNLPCVPLPPNRQSHAIDATRGIDETLFVKIGGIDQWISIRGQDRDNPVLPLLHRGPGLPTSPYPRQHSFRLDA